MRFSPTNNCKSCDFRGPIQYRDEHECSVDHKRRSLGYICSFYCNDKENVPIINSKQLRKEHEHPS